MSASNKIFEYKKNLLKTFDTSYNKLNQEQKKVVDTIEGLCAVNAGPGTGKTEVLSLRIANILNKLDASPNNILCLTYTEAGARNMRERVARFLGNKSTKVNISTFHSFASEIINNYPEYFFDGARFVPIDSVTQYQLYTEIFKTLPLRYKTSSYHPKDGYVYLGDVKNTITSLKKEGIDEQFYSKIIDFNEKYLNSIEKQLVDVIQKDKISSRSKDWIEKLSQTSLDIASIINSTKLSINDYKNHFGNIDGSYAYYNLNIVDSMMKLLEDAVKSSIEIDKSTPFSQYKKSLLKKTDNGFKLKELESIEINRETCHIYRMYKELMYQKGFYDFDDMILELIDKLEKNQDLVFELQEKYQYILVDEFQDTNGSQLRIIETLINGVEDPNLLVVGDTDQTIFKFQGALSGNLENFVNRYKNVVRINMFTNYRSNQNILNFAEMLIVQSANRDSESKKCLVSGKS